MVLKDGPNKKLYSDSQVEFVKLIQYLLPPSVELDGCEVRIPESVFFDKEGKPIFVVKTDKDGKLTSITQQNKLLITDIRKKFSEIVRQRQRDSRTVAMEYKAIQAEKTREQNEDLAALGNDNQGSPQKPKNNAQEVKAAEPVGNNKDTDRIYYHDAAIIRFRDKADGVSVLNETTFIKTFDNKRPNDPIFTKIELFQTTIKSKWGLGKPIRVEFYAPLNEHNLKDEIQYNYKHMGDDLELQFESKDYQFCYKQCLKMGYYIQTIHGFEILRMYAEFFKDENGYIWFFYAHNIYGRKVQNKTKAMTQEECTVAAAIHVSSLWARTDFMCISIDQLVRGVHR